MFHTQEKMGGHHAMSFRSSSSSIVSVREEKGREQRKRRELSNSEGKEAVALCCDRLLISLLSYGQERKRYSNKWREMNNTS